MKKIKNLFLITAAFFFLPLLSSAFVYPTFDETLPNGLKVIVCEKPGNGFAEIEVWYRVGSKDEKPGIRGMAHMFEHMMFRGTTNVSGEKLLEKMDSVAQVGMHTRIMIARFIMNICRHQLLKWQCILNRIAWRI